MKKLLLFLVALSFGLVSVSAMSESELKTKLTQSYTVNGTTFQVTDSQKTLIERYLNKYEVSSADADYIYSSLEKALDILKKSGKKNFNYLSTSDKNKVIALVSDVSSNTSVDAAIVGNELVVYTPGTASATEFYRAPLNTINGEIATTGSGLVVAGLGIVSMLGIAIAFKKIRNA